MKIRCEACNNFKITGLVIGMFVGLTLQVILGVDGRVTVFSMMVGVGIGY